MQKNWLNQDAGVILQTQFHKQNEALFDRKKKQEQNQKQEDRLFTYILKDL